MPFDANEIFNEIAAATVPAGINPFGAIAEVLHEQVFPNIPKSFYYQCYFISACFGVHLLCFCAATCLRMFRSRDFWLFHLQRTKRGTYIVPNFSICWQTGVCVFLIFLQPYIYYTLRHSSGYEVVGYLNWRYLIWIPAWEAAFTATWAGYVVEALSRVHAGDTRIMSSPTFLNCSFTLGFIGCHFCVLYVGITMSNHFDSMMSRFKNLDLSLSMFATQYTGMHSEQVRAALNTQIPLGQQAFEKTELFIDWFSYSWWTWSAFTFTLHLVFDYSSWRHYQALKSEYRALDDELSSSVPTRRRSVEVALRNTRLTFSVLAFSGLFMIGGTTWLAVEPAIATLNPLALQLETLLNLYGLVISGTAGSFLVLRQALQAPIAAHSGSLASPSEAIQASAGVAAKRQMSVNKVAISVAVASIAETRDSDSEEVYKLELRRPSKWSNGSEAPESTALDEQVSIIVLDGVDKMT